MKQTIHCGDKEKNTSVRWYNFWEIQTYSCNNECTAPPRVKFLSNPRRMHSKGEEEEKEKQGLPRAPICCSTTSPPPPPSPPTHAARLLGCLGPVIRTHLPPPPCCKQAKIQWFLGKAAKKYDSLFLETQKWYGWIRTAFVILYKLEWKW
jgi:hypothetical protein